MVIKSWAMSCFGIPVCRIAAAASSMTIDFALGPLEGVFLQATPVLWRQSESPEARMSLIRCNTASTRRYSSLLFLLCC